MSTGHLDQLLLGIADHELAATPGANRIVISGLSLDSRQVGRGEAFVALGGTQAHGFAFAAGAVQRGAAVILAETPPPGVAVAGVPDELPASLDGVVVLWIIQLREHLGEIAARYYGRPSESMHVLGVTGTNGKTSCVQLLGQAFSFLGLPNASIGTLGTGMAGHLRDSARTTPDVISVQGLLAGFRDRGASHVAMEVSSHALAQERVAGVDFELAVFTNLTRDHLDYHGSMQAYGAAKARLFAWPGLRVAVINIDDAFGAELAQRLAPGVELLTVSQHADAGAAIHASAIDTAGSGLTFTLHTPWGVHAVSSGLLGHFNIDNLLLVAACLGALDVPFERIVAALGTLQPVLGRMSRLGGDGGQPLVVVDYAHTPDALEQALGALREHCAGQLLCVFGCGGERDVGKRPLMGGIAARLADVAIVTDDNPRGEDGDVIVAQILAGMPATGPHLVERDRAKAIALALARAGAGDVVLIAGKGHETYQDGATGRHPFNDLAVAAEALRCRSPERQA
jgi:UDP-N-acetylmuramoyl-L-alanyl-D-glutamate--2,6-diaminopimelate ligase